MTAAIGNEQQIDGSRGRNPVPGKELTANRGKPNPREGLCQKCLQKSVLLSAAHFFCNEGPLSKTVFILARSQVYDGNE